MITLTKSQLGLLNLVRTESAPTIEDIHCFALGYGALVQSLREDYLTLLKEFLVQPIGIIHPRYYLPTACLINKRGQEYLHEILQTEPEKIPPRTPSYSRIASFQHKQSIEEVTNDWPILGKLAEDEVGTLADVYLHWAQNPGVEGIRIPVKTRTRWDSYQIQSP